MCGARVRGRRKSLLDPLLTGAQPDLACESLCRSQKAKQPFLAGRDELEPGSKDRCLHDEVK